ncbi:N-acetylglucosamine kinase [Paenibacillus hodogayensis]|uniref:N-acetylglucosamine kinase n=1 Tax=Paenibacillus hodogayensis TaxID=279208 RepID=A0ABV5VVZ8_9BACL
MSQTKLPLLAIDGGGTKCLVVIADTEGNTLGQGRAGSCNYQGNGLEAAGEELTQGIREALADWARNAGVSPDYGQIEVDCAVFGIAGLDTDYDRAIISGFVLESLERLSIRANHIMIENDGFAALSGATAGQPGILVIAGTGSIVFGINERGETARAGGWGHIVGDEGSGYWIGKQAVTAILKSYDGRGRPTGLASLILPRLGLNNEEDLFNWVYGSDYSVDKLGELSRLVSQAASDGDPEAERILSDAVQELYTGVSAVVEQLQLKDKPFKIILQGGVLQNDILVRDQLIRKSKEFAPLVEPDTAKKDPIYGVTAMGLAYLKSRG